MVSLQTEWVAPGVGAVGELSGNPEFHASAGPLVRARGKDEVVRGGAGTCGETRLCNAEQLDALVLSLPGEQGRSVGGVKAPGGLGAIPTSLSLPQGAR
eukprot:6028859-Lingulodinium_polyedra.AAC.1